MEYLFWLLVAALYYLGRVAAWNELSGDQNSQNAYWAEKYLITERKPWARTNS